MGRALTGAGRRRGLGVGRAAKRRAEDDEHRGGEPQVNHFPFPHDRAAG